MLSREHKATGPWLIRSDTGQRATDAMLRNDFDDARAEVRKTARRRTKHTDPRTTARHYETLIDSVPASLPKRITDRSQ